MSVAMFSSDTIRLGSRGSQLALWQTRWVAQALQQQHPGLRTEVVVIRTSGDRNRRDPLSQLGGKGLFVKEIEAALAHRQIDLAVHSMKDMPTELPPGLHFGAIPERAEVRDAFVGREGRQLAEATASWRIGTGSLRRQAQLLERHAGLQLCDIRGNVDTRLRKLHAGEADGLVLAAVGLMRLGLQAEITELLPIEVMLPAVGQGALAVESRAGDDIDALLAPLHHVATAQAVTAERSFLAHLSGGCMVPIAALGQREGEHLHLRGLVSSPQGDQVLRREIRGPASEAEALGRQLAEQMLADGARAILERVTRLA
jgi:hydroxymethylbilane synthase